MVGLIGLRGVISSEVGNDIFDFLDWANRCTIFGFGESGMSQYPFEIVSLDVLIFVHPLEGTMVW